MLVVYWYLFFFPDQDGLETFSQKLEAIDTFERIKLIPELVLVSNSIFTASKSIVPKSATIFRLKSR